MWNYYSINSENEIKKLQLFKGCLTWQSQFADTSQATQYLTSRVHVHIYVNELASTESLCALHIVKSYSLLDSWYWLFRCKGDAFIYIQTYLFTDNMVINVYANVCFDFKLIN